MFYWFMKQVMVGPLLRVLYRPWTRGVENVPDSGGAILAVYEAATRTVAAGIDGKNLYVAPEYRGRGIGPEMLILAFEVGLRHPDEMNVENTLSRSGRSNRAAAHRMAVERALEASLDVPPEVLEAYPDLVPGPCP